MTTACGSPPGGFHENLRSIRPVGEEEGEKKETPRDRPNEGTFHFSLFPSIASLYHCSAILRWRERARERGEKPEPTLRQRGVRVCSCVSRAPRSQAAMKTARRRRRPSLLGAPTPAEPEGPNCDVECEHAK